MNLVKNTYKNLIKALVNMFFMKMAPIRKHESAADKHQTEELFE